MDDCRPAVWRQLLRRDGATLSEADVAAAVPHAGAVAELRKARAAPPDAAQLAVTAECVQRLREAADGGDRDLDKGALAGVAIRTVCTDASKFAAWSKDGKPRGGAEWLLPSAGAAGAGAEGARVLFLHGGAYQYYSPSEVYRPLSTRLAAACGLPVLSIDYRLAPEHAFPGAMEDAVAALRWIWENGPDGPAPARRVLVCGDSAGGGLALGAIMAALAADGSARLPSAVATFSAYTDLTMSLPTYTSRAWDADTQAGDLIFSDGDPAAEIVACQQDAAKYYGGADPSDPRISPVFAPAAALAALPPLLMVVGDAEVMLADTVEFAARAVEAGAVHVAVRIWPKMWHVFPMYAEACGQGHELQAAHDAMGEVGRFLRDHA